MNPTFFVFCEGKTEAAYVDLLRRSFRVPVEIIAKVSDSNISRPYIDRCMRERFSTSRDKIFLMFDLDVPGMFDHLSEIKGAELLLSNPCIELWFLLHYMDVSRELSSSECIGLLKSKDSAYSKGSFSPVMSRLLIEKGGDAVARAKGKVRYANPSSTVHLLVEEIRKSGR